jgi:hypothetical protein
MRTCRQYGEHPHDAQPKHGGIQVYSRGEDDSRHRWFECARWNPLASARRPKRSKPTVSDQVVGQQKASPYVNRSPERTVRADQPGGLPRMSRPGRIVPQTGQFRATAPRALPDRETCPPSRSSTRNRTQSAMSDYCGDLATELGLQDPLLAKSGNPVVKSMHLPNVSGARAAREPRSICIMRPRVALGSENLSNRPLGGGALRADGVSE